MHERVGVKDMGKGCVLRPFVKAMVRLGGRLGVKTLSEGFI